MKNKTVPSKLKLLYTNKKINAQLASIFTCAYAMKRDFDNNLDTPEKTLQHLKNLNSAVSQAMPICEEANTITSFLHSK